MDAKTQAELIIYLKQELDNHKTSLKYGATIEQNASNKRLLAEIEAKKELLERVLKQLCTK